jgi:hypothetical protein
MFVAVIEVLRLRRIRSISHAACTEVCAGSIALIADGAGNASSESLGGLVWLLSGV